MNTSLIPITKFLTKLFSLFLANASPAKTPLGVVREESHSAGASFDTLEPSGDQRPENRSNCVSPASSNGGVYSVSSVGSRHQTQIQVVGVIFAHARKGTD